MKITALILCFIAALVSGCLNKPQITTGADGVSVTNFVKAPDIERIARVTGAAANLGSTAWLVKHPGDRAAFAFANENLKGLINSANYDPLAFANALQALPIKELKGADGSLYVSVAMVLWGEALDSAQGLNRQELVAATLKAVQSGIQKTLDATAPRSFYLRDLELRLEEVNMPRSYTPRGPSPVQNQFVALQPWTFR